MQYYRRLHRHAIQLGFVTQQDTIRQIIKLAPLESSINVMMPYCAKHLTVVFNALHASKIGEWGGHDNLLNPDGVYTFSILVEMNILIAFS